MALTVISIRDKRATNTCRLINIFKRNQITQNNNFLNCILFWKQCKNDYTGQQQQQQQQQQQICCEAICDS